MSRRTLFAVGCVLAVSLVTVVWIATDTADNARNHLAVAICREGNLPNGYIRLVLDRNPRFDPQALGVPAPEDALPILSCQQTVDDGRPVRLAPAQERLYLKTLARSRLPVVRHGEVVGSEPLPPAPPPNP
jgi:hypothetical protein